MPLDAEVDVLGCGDAGTLRRRGELADQRVTVRVRRGRDAGRTGARVTRAPGRPAFETALVRHNPHVLHHGAEETTPDLEAQVLEFAHSQPELRHVSED